MSVPFLATEILIARNAEKVNCFSECPFAKLYGKKKDLNKLTKKKFKKIPPSVTRTIMTTTNGD